MFEQEFADIIIR